MKHYLWYYQFICFTIWHGTVTIVVYQKQTACSQGHIRNLSMSISGKKSFSCKTFLILPVHSYITQTHFYVFTYFTVYPFLYVKAMQVDIYYCCKLLQLLHLLLTNAIIEIAKCIQMPSVTSIFQCDQIQGSIKTPMYKN